MSLNDSAPCPSCGEPAQIVGRERTYGQPLVHCDDCMTSLSTHRRESESPWRMRVSWLGRAGSRSTEFTSEATARSAAAAYINGNGGGDAHNVRSVVVEPTEGRSEPTKDDAIEALMERFKVPDDYAERVVDVVAEALGVEL